MPQPSPIRIQLGLRGWAAIAAALAILAAGIFLAIGLLVFLLPVLLLAPVLYWLLPKPKMYRAGNPAAGKTAEGATIIDGEFRVMDVPPAQEDGEKFDAAAWKTSLKIKADTALWGGPQLVPRQDAIAQGDFFPILPVSRRRGFRRVLLSLPGFCTIIFQQFGIYSPRSSRQFLMNALKDGCGVLTPVGNNEEKIWPRFFHF